MVAGPQAITLDRSRFPNTGFRHQVFRRYWDDQSGIKATPVERGPLDAGVFTIGKYTGSWSYCACPEDHSVDHSGYYPAAHFLRSWAYVEAAGSHPQTVAFVLTTYGAADMWLGDEHAYRIEHDQDQPTRVTYVVRLK